MYQKTGEEKTVVYGFRGTAVFGYEQTEGAPLPNGDPADQFLESLPLIEVAKAWGISVESYNGNGARCLGRYHRGSVIALGMRNLSTWAHELVHAADHRNGNMTELGRHWRKEVVAELGGAVLLRMLDHDHDADLGGCWDYLQHYAYRSGLEVLDACGKVLERTCAAVTLILDTAQQFQTERARLARGARNPSLC